MKHKIIISEGYDYDDKIIFSATYDKPPEGNTFSETEVLIESHEREIVEKKVKEILLNRGISESEIELEYRDKFNKY